MRYVEERRGLCVKLKAEHGRVLAQTYIDKKTLPPGAAEFFADGFLDQGDEIHVATVERSSDRFLATGVVASAPVPGPDGKPVLTLTYSGELVGLGDSIGFVMQGLRDDFDQFRAAVHRDVEVWSKAGRAIDWETRLAVVARWDRDYGPGELVGSVGPNGRPLATVELAAISVLCGSEPSLGRERTVEEWTPARVIDVEAKYVAGVRRSLERLRQRVPIPRFLGVTVEE